MILEFAVRTSYCIKKSWLFILTLITIFTFFLFRFSLVKAQNISINSTKNCDSNAVIFCGANSVNQIVNKFNIGDGLNSAKSIHHIFSFFGISTIDINSMKSADTLVEPGWVSKSGNVFNSSNKLIATNALTGGRENISGSTRVNVDGTVFFTRPPSVSFENHFLAAFIVMKDGHFDFAILSSCGNAVKATPIMPKPAPTPPPAPIAPQTPSMTNNVCTGNTTNSNSVNSVQGGNCSSNTTVVQTQSTNNTPPNPTTPVQSPTNLISTGSNTNLLILIFILTSISGTLYYHRWLRNHLTD